MTVVAIGVIAGLFGMSMGLATTGDSHENQQANEHLNQHPPAPILAAAIPIPEQSSVAATSRLCALPSMQEALATGDVSQVVLAAGSAEQFRRAVASGTHECLLPNNPSQTWVVVNKARSVPDVSWKPSDLVGPAIHAQVEIGLRAEAAAALDAMATAAREEGAGDIALNSGFRSYETQVASYESQVESAGQTEADHQSARPGHSEHQTGLAADVVPCNPECATLDDVAGSAQGAWIAEHGWRFGWIIRYEDGYADITGYSAEPWHLRYIGVDLATLYHDGGFHTLEEFFELPAAPDYTG